MYFVIPQTITKSDVNKFTTQVIMTSCAFRKVCLLFGYAGVT